MFSYAGVNPRTSIKNAPGADTMWPGLRFSSTGEAAWVLFDCNDLAELTRMIKALAGATGMKPQNAPAADTMSPGLRLVRSRTGTFLYTRVS